MFTQLEQAIWQKTTDVTTNPQKLPSSKLTPTPTNTTHNTDNNKSSNFDSDSDRDDEPLGLQYRGSEDSSSEDNCNITNTLNEDSDSDSKGINKCNSKRRTKLDNWASQPKTPSKTTILTPTTTDSTNYDGNNDDNDDNDNNNDNNMPLLAKQYGMREPSSMPSSKTSLDNSRATPIKPLQLRGGNITI